LFLFRGLICQSRPFGNSWCNMRFLPWKLKKFYLEHHNKCPQNGLEKAHFGDTSYNVLNRRKSFKRKNTSTNYQYWEKTVRDSCYKVYQYVEKFKCPCDRNCVQYLLNICMSYCFCWKCYSFKRAKGYLLSYSLCASLYVFLNAHFILCKIIWYLCQSSKMNHVKIEQLLFHDRSYIR